jgi:hypothetical protein
VWALDETVVHVPEPEVSVPTFHTPTVPVVDWLENPVPLSKLGSVKSARTTGASMKVAAPIKLHSRIWSWRFDLLNQVDCFM